MRQCPKCNANISDTAKFCPMCGCNIKKYEEENNKKNKIYCQECGAELEKGTMFCAECGSKISSFEQVQNSDIFNDDFLSNIVSSTNQQIEEKIKDISIGDTLTFGTYFIDYSERKKPIEWLVLEKKENKLLLISKYAIDSRFYGYNEETVWEKCDLRRWLNNSFMKNAFNSDEKNRLLNTYIHTEKNQKFGTNGCNDTIDKIFLLSVNEVEQYFPIDKSRICYATEYAKRHGVDHDFDNKCRWWLRTPGEDIKSAVTIMYDGEIYYRGPYTDDNDIGVRPALWIDCKI